jgi:iron complex transport system permease protein
MVKTARPFLISLLLLALALVLSVAYGAIYIPPVTLLRLLGSELLALGGTISETFSVILFDIRLPHTALMALAGAALAGSGAAYQGLFRNPLADPYLIGAAAGAGLGAILAMSAQGSLSMFGIYALPAAAFLGAMATVILVYVLSRTAGGPGAENRAGTTLILSGVAVSSFATSLTSFLILRSQGEVRRAFVWMLGGSAIGGWDPVFAALPYVVLGLGVLLLSGHTLNVLQFGEDQAHTLGLRVGRARLVLIAGASLATAAAIAFTGLIGFVGLIVPHLVRLVWGPDYRSLIPLSILCGAASLLIFDLLARTLLAPQELPVGIVTALAGAPFFLWVLRRSQRYKG